MFQANEPDRLFKQGIEQFQARHYEAACQSWQQALTIYRKIGDGCGEFLSYKPKTGFKLDRLELLRKRHLGGLDSPQISYKIRQL